MKRARTLYPAKNRWALDSGGFSELSTFGEWKITPEQYAKVAERYYVEIGKLDFIATQDWMCEPFIIKKTGLSVYEHQIRTIDSYKQLTDLKPDLPWMPVIQGFEKDDYLFHVDMYSKAGIDLFSIPIVGIGSICRRQDTKEAEDIIKTLAGFGLNLHGFGFKIKGLRKVHSYLKSADSAAWSYNARRNQPLPGCTHKHCGSCSKYAIQWRNKLLVSIGEPCTQ